MTRREIVENTLVGALLLGAAAVIGLAMAAPLVAGLFGAQYLFKHFFPAVVVPNYFVLLAVYGVLSLVYGVGHLRSQRWRNAFLSLVIIPVVFSWWWSSNHRPTGDDSFPSIWFILIVLVVPGAVRVSRYEFLLSASIASTVMALNFGIMGSGQLAHASWMCTEAAAFALFVLFARRNWAEPDIPHRAHPTVV